MDALILEINTQGLHRYHLIDQPNTRIGRALDNDIILSESTVAPYHIEIIRLDDGSVELHNLAVVNPARFNGIVDKSMLDAKLPIDIKLGRINARILSPQHSVATTKLLAGNGHSTHLFGHAIWAILLIALCFLVSGVEYYLHSYTSFKWASLAKFLGRETLLYLAGLIFSLAILERLISNRWELKPLAIVVSLTYLLHQLVSPMVEQLGYIFSSHLPESLFGIIWYSLLIPFVIGLYLININHLKPSKGIGLAILLSSPFIVLAVLEVSQIGGYLKNFSTSANYHNSLSALNWHSDETVSITTFIEQAKKLHSGEPAD
jgi:hypothetical protein